MYLVQLKERVIHRPTQHEEEFYGGQKEDHVAQPPFSTQSSPTAAETRRLGLIGEESIPNYNERTATDASGALTE